MWGVVSLPPLSGSPAGPVCGAIPHPGGSAVFLRAGPFPNPGKESGVFPKFDYGALSSPPLALCLQEGRWRKAEQFKGLCLGG